MYIIIIIRLDIENKFIQIHTNADKTTYNMERKGGMEKIPDLHNLTKYTHRLLYMNIHEHIHI